MSLRNSSSSVSVLHYCVFLCRSVEFYLHLSTSSFAMHCNQLIYRVCTSVTDKQDFCGRSRRQGIPIGHWQTRTYSEWCVPLRGTIHRLQLKLTFYHYNVSGCQLRLVFLQADDDSVTVPGRWGLRLRLLQVVLDYESAYRSKGSGFRGNKHAVVDFAEANIPYITNIIKRWLICDPSETHLTIR